MAGVAIIPTHNLGAATRGKPVNKDPRIYQTPPPIVIGGQFGPMPEPAQLTAHGYDLETKKSYQGLDTGRLKALIESSLCGTLAPGYFEKPVVAVVIEKEYRAVAIVTEIQDADGKSHLYLCKFGVAPECQGNGLGRALMQALKDQYPELIWRTANIQKRAAANKLYASKASGPIQIDNWNIYWHGMSPEAAAALAPIVAELPKTLL